MLKTDCRVSPENQVFGDRRYHRVMNPAKQLTPTAAADLVDSVDVFIFDCDGVIWKGDRLVDGVYETLELLRSKGKQLVFVTNNSSKSRRKNAEKFHSLGISVGEVGSNMFWMKYSAAAMYLKSIDFPKDKKVYVFGMDGILEELELAGFTGLGGTVGAVVVGIHPFINYYKLQFHIATSRMCMVGDRFDTDILFGQSAGCVTTESILKDPSNEIQPDYYTSKVPDFLELLGQGSKN
ncbi:Phosphoglycolate phosphatase 2-like protein [Drosera capensis]